MGKVAEKTVSTISEYTAAVESLLPNASSAPIDRKLEGNWYRGVGLAKTHGLQPGLFRHPGVSKIEDLLKLERTMLEDFRRQGALHAELRGSDGDFMALFVMQHHGIPTRLLDWSVNPFTALYFALSSAVREAGSKRPAYRQDAAIWVLDPIAWNECALRQNSYGNGGPLSQTQATEFGYDPKKIISGGLEPNAVQYMKDSPAAILGITNSPRMLAQRGVFTVFGRDTSPMEEQVKRTEFNQTALTKLVVPRAVIPDLLSTLIRLGYTDSVSFPDLHGLAMEIRRVRGFGV